MNHVAGGPSPELPAREASVPHDDDEPYTIKCICHFEDDDGATVFCERCETWQHIECYYPGKRVPEVHNCVDCEPRPVDEKRAQDRQRRRRELGTVHERKVRRPPAKVSKRKPKDAGPNGVHLNGCPVAAKAATLPPSDRRNGVARDQPPPAKRPKTTHRPSSSVTSHAAEHKRTGSIVPPVEARPIPALSPPDSASDAHSPLVGQRPDYFGFEYPRKPKADPAESPLPGNIVSDAAVGDAMAAWANDEEALRRVTHGHNPTDVFHFVGAPWEVSEWPELVVRTKNATSSLDGYASPTAVQPYLRLDSFIPAGGVVGELKGRIGYLQDYYREATSRGLTLRHPEPLVFFHPHLPICIDARRDGTPCRFVRRSCRPNVVLRTIVSAGAEYHFCLCATESLEPGTEITLGWDPDGDVRALLGRALGDTVFTPPFKSEKLTPAEHDEVADWVERVLAAHGGCACYDAARCAFARIGRRRSSEPLDAVQTWSDQIKPHKFRDPASHHSPANNGAMVNGRALGGMHLSREHDEDHNDDSRSTSGSFPSKPHSRDMTPLTHFSSDLPTTTPGSELSDREKRKIAAVERTFEQLEQEHHHQSQRKKKRNSSQANLPTTAPPTTMSTPHPFSARVHSPDVHLQRRPTARSTSTSQPTTPSAVVKTEDVHHGVPYPIDTRPSSNGQRGPPSTSSSVDDPSHEPLPSRPSSYVDADAQTEPSEVVWHQRRVVLSARRPVVPLTRKLLVRCHADRIRHEELERKRQMAWTAPEPAAPTSTSAPSDETALIKDRDVDVNTPLIAATLERRGSGEVKLEHEPELAFATQTLGLAVQKPRPPDASEGGLLMSDETPLESLEPLKPPPPAPVAAAASGAAAAASVPPSRPLRHPEAVAVGGYSRSVINGPRSAGLRVQLPTAGHGSSVSASMPWSAGACIQQSPHGPLQPPVPFSPSVIGSVTQPSPIKKKLSLSDYVSRKREAEAPLSGNSASTNAPSKLASSPLIGEVKGPGAGQGATGAEAPGKPAEGTVVASPSGDAPVAP